MNKVKTNRDEIKWKITTKEIFLMQTLFANYQMIMFVKRRHTVQKIAKIRKKFNKTGSVMNGVRKVLLL